MLEFNIQAMSCGHCVKAITEAVHEVDPQAFMVIGTAHEALGEGFRPLKS